MITEFERDLKILKRRVKKMKKEQNIPHSTALNKIANQIGFQSWALLMKSLNKKEG